MKKNKTLSRKSDKLSKIEEAQLYLEQALSFSPDKMKDSIVTYIRASPHDSLKQIL
jgi:hypothetical protein